MRAIDDYIAEAGKISLFDILGFPNWIPRPGRIKSAPALKEMKAMADGAIEARSKRGHAGVPDLLDFLLQGVDPKTKRQMSTAELRDNLLTFIVTDHETTTLTLAWSMYLVGFDQCVRDRARAEAQSVLQGRACTGDDVANLPYIRMIIDEALCMYPAAGIISRTAQKKDTLGGREVLPGDTVMIPIYALGRNELLWEDPEPVMILTLRPEGTVWMTAEPV